MKQLLLFCLLSVASVFAVAQTPSLVPQPLELETVQGRSFTLSPKTPIAFSPQLRAQAEYLRHIIFRSTGYRLPLQQGGKKGIVLTISGSETRPEAYRLNIHPKGVRIDGADVAGVINGVQTLLQCFPAEIYSARLVDRTAWTAPALRIYDAPNRPWRGMMLDVARYFLDVDFLKRYIDLMAYYKLNKLQLHLIDDSGWRLEMKQFPRLTEVGAHTGPAAHRVGGFYTQEQMRELIAYAAVRNVEIIPEIEFPAHILSAIVAYPELSCTGKQHELPLQHFISRDLLCVGRPESLQFLEKVLDEVIALFPSPIIHIGGDEAVYDRWKECPRCQALLKREGLEKAEQLQGWLTNRVAELMARRQRTVMGWEEIIQRGKVDQPVIALIWHNEADSIQATQAGHKAVLTPASHLYFDFPEDNAPGEVQAATWMPPISLQKAYSMPMNDYSPTSTVLGAQGCLWTDQFIHGDRLRELQPLAENRAERYVEYLTLPRLVALSELCWLPTAQRSWESFAARNTYNYQRLDAQGYLYRLPLPEATKVDHHEGFAATFTLRNPLLGARLVYTTDGTNPHRHSTPYTQPVSVTDKEMFRAALVYDNAGEVRVSLPYHLPPDYAAYQKLGEYVGRQRIAPAQASIEEETYELSGRIRQNGQYTLHLVEEQATTPSAITCIEVYKRDECIATLYDSAQPTLLGKGQTQSFSFVVDNFEAGTPFRLKIVRQRPAGAQHFLLFLQQPQ